ncbi:hypothetical protein FS837_006428 [Tulasnella sp. UAMH 9824]|nr:hypothetical protein FS837_006428 [Tulasnella sp. UAMH 9824]
MMAAQATNATRQPFQKGLNPTGRNVRIFSGKMLTAPMKWKVNGRRRQQEQEQEQEQEDRMTEVGDDNEEGEGDERPQPRRRETTASRASPTTPAVETPIPASPSLPPPASLQPPNATSTPQVQAGEDDDDDPTAIQPPRMWPQDLWHSALRAADHCARCSFDSDEPESVGEAARTGGCGRWRGRSQGYMYLAGMMPSPVRSNTVTSPSTRNDAALAPRRMSVIEQDRDDEDEEEMALMRRTQKRLGGKTLRLTSRRTTRQLWLGCTRAPVLLPLHLHSTPRMEMDRT